MSTYCRHSCSLLAYYWLALQEHCSSLQDEERLLTVFQIDYLFLQPTAFLSGIVDVVLYFIFPFSFMSRFSERILVFFFILKFPPNWGAVATEGPLWTSMNGTFCWKQKKSFCQLLLFLPCFLLLSWSELSWFSMEFKRRLSLPSFFVNGYERHSLCM